MPQDIRLWEIQEKDALKAIKRAKLDMEERIETWLEKDISIISDDLCVIGRQVPTDFGGVIDLLCLDYNGDIVIIELKREKTPREISAQMLDYASWVKDLSNERITEIAERYFAGKNSLENAFRNKFGSELPEILNEHHKMLIVASEIDGSTERIVNYLSDTYGVGINAVTFQYFCDQDKKEFLARVFLIEPDEVDYKSQTRTSSKREPPLTYEELQAIAEQKGVGELYDRLAGGLTDYFDQRITTRSTVAFVGIMNASRHTIFSIAPKSSDSETGLRCWIYIERLLEYFEATREDIDSCLPSDIEEGETYKGSPLTLFVHFKNTSEVNTFLGGLAKPVKQQ